LGLLAVVAGWAVQSGPAWAQQSPELQPAIVISMASLNEQFADGKHLSKAAGVANLWPMAEAGMQQFLNGIDRTKPIGAALYFREGAQHPNFVGFVPVTNLDDVLDLVAENADVDDSEEIVKITAPDGTELRVKEAGGYALVTDQADLLALAPQDPNGLLGTLPNQYNFAVRLDGQQVPEELRDQFIKLIEEGYERQLEMMDQGDDDGEDSLQEMQMNNFRQTIDQLRQFADELDELVVGLSIDAEGQRIVLDGVFNGIEGSSLQQQGASLAQTVDTRFAGFLMDGAAFTMHAHARLSEEDAARTNGMLDQMLPQMFKAMQEEGNMGEEEAAMVRDIVERLADALRATIKEGTVDGGATVVLDDSHCDLVLGMHVADAQQVDAVIRDVVAQIQPQVGDKATFHLNDSTENGVTYHRVAVPVPEDEEEAREVFGPEITILVGIADKSVYVAVGRSPRDTLNRALEGSRSAPASKLPPVQYNVYLAPILEFVGRVAPDSGPQAEVVRQMAQKLKEGGRDRIRFTLDAATRGQAVQVEIQDGVLALIGVAMENFGGMMGGGADF
jgi:hypothetical protein